MFTDLKQAFGKEDIAFHLSSSSRAIEWRKNKLSRLEQYVDQIYISLYKYLHINKKLLKDTYIYTLGC